jgi:5-methylcytosine-specific restriction endonuclease McrA
MYDRMPKKEVKFTRHNIFERDKDTCQYCGKVFDRKDLNLDHVDSA